MPSVTPGFRGRARPGRQEHAIRVQRHGLGRRDLVVAEDALLHAQLPKVLDEVEGEGVVVVDDEQHVDYWQNVARGLTAGSSVPGRVLDADGRTLPAPENRYSHGGPARPVADAARHDRDADLHAGGHAGHGEVGHAAAFARDRRADHPGQHVSPEPAAGQRTGARARRVAPVHGLGRADPDRQRRLPGLLAGEAARHPGRRRGVRSRISMARSCFSARAR